MCENPHRTRTHHGRETKGGWRVRAARRAYIPSRGMRAARRRPFRERGVPRAQRIPPSSQLIFCSRPSSSLSADAGPRPLIHCKIPAWDTSTYLYNKLEESHESSTGVWPPPPFNITYLNDSSSTETSDRFHVKSLFLTDPENYITLFVKKSRTTHSLLYYCINIINSIVLSWEKTRQYMHKERAKSLSRVVSQFRSETSRQNASSGVEMKNKNYQGEVFQADVALALAENP